MGFQNCYFIFLLLFFLLFRELIDWAIICFLYRFILRIFQRDTCILYNWYVLSLSRLLKGRSIPGKILLSQRVDPIDNSSLYSPTYSRSSSYNDTGTSDHKIETVEVILVFVFCGYVLLYASIILIGSTYSSVTSTLNTGGSSQWKQTI
jgi:hypothetical protein